MPQSHGHTPLRPETPPLQLPPRPLQRLRFLLTASLLMGPASPSLPHPQECPPVTPTHQGICPAWGGGHSVTKLVLALPTSRRPVTQLKRFPTP